MKLEAKVYNVFHNIDDSEDNLQLKKQLLINLKWVQEDMIKFGFTNLCPELMFNAFPRCLWTCDTCYYLFPKMHGRMDKRCPCGEYKDKKYLLKRLGLVIKFWENNLKEVTKEGGKVCNHNQVNDYKGYLKNF